MGKALDIYEPCVLSSDCFDELVLIYCLEVYSDELLFRYTQIYGSWFCFSVVFPDLEVSLLFVRSFNEVEMNKVSTSVIAKLRYNKNLNLKKRLKILYFI